MLDFIFENKTKIIFGKDMYENLYKEIHNYGNKVLLVYGSNSIINSGLYKIITNKAKENCIVLNELSGVKPNPILSLVQEGIDICKNNEVDFILAVGGGSVIDTAKAIAFGAKSTGNVWDYFEGKTYNGDALPIGVVLTIAAAGSESSHTTIITNKKNNYKRAFSAEVLRPKFALLNPELTYTLPKKQTIAGGVDIISHVFERYFTRVRGVDLTDRLCESLIKSMIKNLHVVLKDPNDYEARAEIMWAGTLAHNGLLGTGRQEDWGAHMIAHEISALYDITHGFTLSIIIPAWMKYVYKEDVGRFAQYANRVWNVEIDVDDMESTALKGIKLTEKFFFEIGAPIRLSDINIDGNKLEEMSSKCVQQGAVGAFKSLDYNDVRKIFELAI